MSTNSPLIMTGSLPTSVDRAYRVPWWWVRSTLLFFSPEWRWSEVDGPTDHLSGNEDELQQLYWLDC